MSLVFIIKVRQTFGKALQSKLTNDAESDEKWGSDNDDYAVKDACDMWSDTTRDMWEVEE